MLNNDAENNSVPDESPLDGIGATVNPNDNNDEEDILEIHNYQDANHLWMQGHRIQVFENTAFDFTVL